MNKDGKYVFLTFIVGAIAFYFLARTYNPYYALVWMVMGGAVAALMYRFLSRGLRLAIGLIALLIVFLAPAMMTKVLALMVALTAFSGSPAALLSWYLAKRQSG